jgi:hypothetical protein
MSITQREGIAMNFEKVWDKVNEARFFSNKLHEVHEPMSQTNSEAFRYYFSALLNASYSVEKFAETEFIIGLEKQGRQGEKSWKQYRQKWCESLPSEEQMLWRSLTEYGGIRGREVHVQQTKTTAKDKAIPFRPDSSRATQAYRAFLVMQQAWVFPGVAALENELNLPAGASAWSYIKEHWVEIEGKSRPIAEISDEIVKLCERFVRDLEEVTA